MPRRKTLIHFTSIRVRPIFQGGTFMEHHCSKKKLSLTKRWPVPRGHIWSMLIWFMVSVHRLHWDNYSGSLQGPSDTIRLLWVILHCTHNLIGKMWGFFFQLQYCGSRILRVTFTESEWKTVQTNKLSSSFTTDNSANSCQRIVCMVPCKGEKKTGIDTGSILPPFHWSSQVLAGKVIFAVMYCLHLLGVQSYC